MDIGKQILPYKKKEETKMKNWEYDMHTVVRKAVRDKRDDVVNLYLQLEKASKPLLESGEMKEGNSFRVPLEDGTMMDISFYKDYSIVDVTNLDGKTERAVSKEDSYKNEYRFLEGSSFMLNNVGLGIGPHYPKEFEKSVQNTKVGDILHFDNNKVYVCMSKTEDQTAFVRVSNGDKTPNVKDIQKYDYETVIKGSPLSLQNFYRKVRDEYTDDVKFKVSSITSARELLNSLIANRSDSKELVVGPNKFFVKPAKEGKGLSYYDNSGNLVSEERMLFLLGWLQASPNTVNVNRFSNFSSENEFKDMECKRNFEHMMSENHFEEAFSFLSGYLSVNEGSVQIDMSSYVQEGLDFEAVSYILENKSGELSIKKLSYVDNDFTKEVSKVEDVSLADVMMYCNDKYNKEYNLVKSSVISQIYKDYPNWNGKYLAAYIEKSTLDIMGTIFNTNINAVNKDSAAFMNAHFDKEENDERDTDYDLS